MSKVDAVSLEVSLTGGDCDVVRDGCVKDRGNRGWSVLW